MNEKQIKVLGMIAKDMEDDVREFEGKPFTGKNVSEFFGKQAAAIQALANIMTDHLQEK